MRHGTTDEALPTPVAPTPRAAGTARARGDGRHRPILEAFRDVSSGKRRQTPGTALRAASAAGLPPVASPDGEAPPQPLAMGVLLPGRAGPGRCQRRRRPFPAAARPWAAAARPFLPAGARVVPAAPPLPWAPGRGGSLPRSRPGTSLPPALGRRGESRRRRRPLRSAPLGKARLTRPRRARPAAAARAAGPPGPARPRTQVSAAALCARRPAVNKGARPGRGAASPTPGLRASPLPPRRGRLPRPLRVPARSPVRGRAPWPPRGPAAEAAAAERPGALAGRGPAAQVREVPFVIFWHHPLRHVAPCCTAAVSHPSDGCVFVAGEVIPT